MPKTEPLPVRFSEAQSAILKRVSTICGVSEAEIARWAVNALGDYFQHHGERLLLPLRFHETFFVYQVSPPPHPLLPRQSKRIRAVVVTDAAGLVLSIDPAFTEMCGYSLEELRGKKPGDVLQGPATEQEIVEQFREAIREQVPFECTLTNYHKNGSTYRVHIKCDPVFERGRLVRFRALETLVDPPTILLEPPAEPKSDRVAGRSKKKKSAQRPSARE